MATLDDATLDELANACVDCAGFDELGQEGWDRPDYLDWIRSADREEEIASFIFD